VIARELLGAFALVSVFGVSSGAVPLQCGGSDTPAELRTEDTAGDALWDLAAKFRAEHDDAAAKETLQYLVAQYPSSRHAGAAKELLARLGDVAAADGG
jgi:hypothetical protein